LYYFWKKKLGYHNEIGPLEERLRKHMFVGDEPDEQGFIYHYKMDHHKCLWLGDGSDKYVAVYANFCLCKHLCKCLYNCLWLLGKHLCKQI
jgi:hypothetical protein